MSAIHQAQGRTMGTVAPTPLDSCAKRHLNQHPVGNAPPVH